MIAPSVRFRRKGRAHARCKHRLQRDRRALLRQRRRGKDPAQIETEYVVQNVYEFHARHHQIEHGNLDAERRFRIERNERITQIQHVVRKDRVHEVPAVGRARIIFVAYRLARVVRLIILHGNGNVHLYGHDPGLRVFDIRVYVHVLRVRRIIRGPRQCLQA